MSLRERKQFRLPLCVQELKGVRKRLIQWSFKAPLAVERFVSSLLCIAAVSAESLRCDPDVIAALQLGPQKLLYTEFGEMQWV